MPRLAELPWWFVTSVAVAFGLVLGSFLNVVVHRLPRQQSLWRPGSRCPGCGEPIRAYDNIPVLSWLLLRGRARCCNARIAARYPIVEALGGLLAWAVVQTHVAALPPTAPVWEAATVFALYTSLGLGLIAAAFIDLEQMYLPDAITLGGTALGLASVPLRWEVGWLEALIGAAAGFVMVWLPFDVAYRAVRGQPGMGLGDAKLVMLAGAWFGWRGAVFTLLAGAVQGTVVALVVLLVRGRLEEPDAVRRERQQWRERLEAAVGEEREQLERELARDPLADPPEPGVGKARLAFGPFLVLASLEFLLFGPALIEWTLGEPFGP